MTRYKVIIVVMLAICAAILIFYLPLHFMEPSVHPRLLQLAEESPQTRVDVIIQLRNSDPQLPTLVLNNGGSIIRMLPIVNGFAAEVPAGIIPKLASLPSVRWISPDSLIHATY